MVNVCEGIVYEYLKKLGCSIMLGKFETEERGVPDFIADKNGKRYFIEVKSDFGNLGSEQVAFMSKFSDTYLFVVNEFSKKIRIFKMEIKELKELI